MAQPQDQKPYVPKKDEPPTFKPQALKDKEATQDQIIVKFKEGAGSSSRAEARMAAGLEKKKDLNLIDAEVDNVKGQSVERAIEALKRRSDVEYAEPDYINYPSGYADEPQFGQLWGLDNTGQTINGISGTADMDINAKEASAVTQGDQNLLVAVLDDGVDFTHADLKGRAWKNPGESGSGKETNGVDDDGNGYVDDVNGWDFVYEDNTVHDPGGDAHGTHVSGTLAASVNGEGIVGVAPNIQIMALKVLGPNGGYTSDAIEALAYAKSKGAKISNNSWGCQSDGGYTCDYSQALYDAINNSDSLFVAAAGDAGYDNDDYWSFYPASYNLSNILSVGAVDNQGKLASSSNYGASSVDILAPGVSILSSVPGIPGDAATLSSVGSSGGKALTAGFGAEEIGESAKRSSFFTKAFTAVGRGSQQVVLVDDDADDLGLPDVGPSVSSAIQGATGSAPQVIDVPYGSDGPDLSKLSGKTVVWATGRAFLSKSDEDCYYYYSYYYSYCPGYGYYNGYYVTKTTLTSTDQATLKNFLDGGGKLIITGMDALFLIEGSPFVSSTLNLDVASRVGGETFSGASGTAFAGESYTFNSPTANAPSHAMVVPATSAAVLQGSYPAIPPGWESWSGTSMATPHATGAAALAASVEPALLNNPGDLKKRIMNGKPLVAAAGKTVSGDMVDALKAAHPPADSTAPTVSIVTPIGGATNVDTTTNVVASFSEAMDAASVTDPANFTLRNGGCNTPATLSYASATKQATLDPSAPLDTATTYTVTISGAWDLAGNQLDQDPNTAGDRPETSLFTTAGSPPPNVWAWGRNENGTLGDCTTTQRTTPQQVGGLKNVTDVAAGCDHSLAVKDDGTVWAWGWNGHGQLGNGTSDLDAHTSPVKVSGLSGVTDVAAGCSHSLALKDDGTVWAWGLGENGQLGDGTATKRTSPVKVSGLSGVTDVAGSGFHSLAIKDDGTVWIWGYYGTTTPVQVSGLSGVTDVAAGGGHNLAIKDDGTLWVWGQNNFGQLGVGTQTDHTTPVQISSLSSVTDVAGGAHHSLAVTDDGTVWAWGSNSDYQLGVDTTPYWSRTTPAKVSGISNVVSVSAGTDQSLAVKDDGTVWTWGSWHSGNTGGLNDCCTTYNKSPVQVGGLSGITYAVAGLRDSPYHNLAVSSDSPPPPGDSQAPSAPTITSPQNNTYDKDGSFSVSGTAEASSSVELFEGTTSRGITKASSSGAWSIALSGVSDGSHTYAARATDAANNTSSASNSVTVKVDSAPPETNIASGPSGPTNDNTPLFSFSGSDNLSQAANLRYSYKVDGGAWSSYSFETSVTLGGTSGLSEGSHTFYVKAKDEAGNEDQSPAQRSFTVDTTQPMVNNTTPSGATPVARGTNLTATFSEKMVASTVNTTTFKLFKVNSDGTQTQITDVVVSLSSDGLTATLNPFGSKTTLLARNTKYKGVITTGTKDLAGNPLAQQTSWTFTTKS